MLATAAVLVGYLWNVSVVWQLCLLVGLFRECMVGFANIMIGV